VNQKYKESITIAMQIILPIVIIIAVVEGLVISGVITTEPAASLKNEEVGAENVLESVTAKVILNYGDGNISSYDITTKNATVYGFLLECAEHEGFLVKTTYYGNYDSLFVDSIGAYVGGQDGKYWQYYMNGVYASLGADKQIVKNGDIIEWRFEGF